MSFQTLNSAISGLRVAQQQLNLISNNVANVGTEGYTRKILPQSSQIIPETGQVLGVKAEVVIRQVDLKLERDLWTQISGASGYETTAAYLDKIQTFHGPPDKELSIAAAISKLKDDFIALSDSPNDGFLQQGVVSQAERVATKFNEFAALVTELRNDAQNEIEQSVNRVNGLLEQIADYNAIIKETKNLNRSSAAAEDSRDLAIKKLSEELEISSFMRSDGVLVVQTRNGTELATDSSQTLYLDGSVVGPLSYYPDSVGGIYIEGNPDREINPAQLGGKLGALVDLRDNNLPEYQAQMDEIAHKLALRMEAQGLRLFTDSNGLVPADTPPDSTTVPPTPVEYVSFAGVIQVNTAIANNVSLVQQGTYTPDITIPPNSNEVIRRVLEFSFGDVSHQEAQGSIDIRSNATGGVDLQNWLGLFSQNSIVTGIDIGSFSEIDNGAAGGGDLVEALQSYFPNYPADDQLQITFEEPRLALGPTTITLDLSDASANFPIGGAVNDALDQIIAEINAQITAAAVPAGLAASASRNVNGQLVINSRGNITIDGNGFAGAMGSNAMNALGLAEGSFTTEDPYFDVYVGNQDAVRITIEPGDTETELEDKLDFGGTVAGVPGLSVSVDAATGYLTLRPGGDGATPNFGGDLRIVGGPITVDQANAAINATLPPASPIPDGAGILSALFGSYTVSSVGPPIVFTENGAVVDVQYQSETANGSGVYASFRSENLGANAAVETGVFTAVRIVDFAQKVINDQASDLAIAEARQEEETILKDLIQREFLDQSAVNIDEEMSNLIVMQTAYAASARMITALDELMEELLNVV